MTRLSIADSLHLAGRMLRKHGYQATDAAYIAEHLVACEIDGLHPLGLQRLTLITNLLAAGYPTGNRNTIVHGSRAALTVDGGGGIGYLATRECITWALDCLQDASVVAFSARNFFLNGALRVYARELADSGYACLLTSSSAPAAVAPPGGREPIVGTNPLCIAVPHRPSPIVFDAAMSGATWSGVAGMAASGLPLADGVAIDRDGQPTTSAAEAIAGSLLAWGGHRGFGLAAAIQTLGILAGAPARPKRMDDCGLIGVAFDCNALNFQSDFEERVEELRVAVMKQGARLPGITWAEKHAAAAQHGIEVDAATWHMLTAPG